MPDSKKPAAAANPACLHCRISELIEAEHRRRPIDNPITSGEAVAALMLIAGDLISDAPGERKGGVFAEAIELLAARSGVIFATSAAPFPTARRVH